MANPKPIAIYNSDEPLPEGSPAPQPFVLVGGDLQQMIGTLLQRLYDLEQRVAALEAAAA